jgi:adenylate cyclase
MSQPGPEAEAESDLTTGAADALWGRILLGTEPRFRRTRKLMKHLPSPPRCQLCAAPFAGLFGPVMRQAGHRRWSGNPKYCAACFGLLEAVRGGAEIDCTLLFADVRGSTTLAEGMSPAAFRRLMDRFYRVSTDVLVEQDGIIDKFVGDEVVAIFIPALAHDAHASRAVAAATALLRATGHADTAGPWLPVGAGIATGVAYVGSVGGGDHVEFTALGDIVNTAARLASAAGPGEVLLTRAAATRADLPVDGLARRTLELKGKAEPVEATVLSARSDPPLGA